MNVPYRLSRYHVATEPVADQANGGRLKRVVFSTRKATAHVVEEAVWERCRRGLLDDLPATIRHELIDAELLVPADEDELQTILDANDTAAQDDRSLYFVIQPTAWCQLGCSYCGQKHTRQMLSEENQDRLVRRVRERLATGRHDTLEVCLYANFCTGSSIRNIERFNELVNQLVAETTGGPFDALLRDTYRDLLKFRAAALENSGGTRLIGLPGADTW